MTEQSFLSFLSRKGFLVEISMKENRKDKTSLIILLIDPHDIFLSGSRELLCSCYPNAKVFTAQNVENTLNQFSTFEPDLVVMDILLAKNLGETPRTSTGINLLTNLIENYPKLNIVIHSTHIKSLVRIKEKIYSHIGGFTVADKILSSKEVVTKVNLALETLNDVKDIKDIHSLNLELKPECLRLVNLAFKEGLKDKAIAQCMCVSERMVRHYWALVQETLGIDCEELKNQGKNLRVMTQIRAREAGLID